MFLIEVLVFHLFLAWCFSDKREIVSERSSMIHSARPHSTAKSDHLNFEFWKRLTEGHTDVQTTCAKIVIPIGRDCGSASWIKKVSERSKGILCDLLITKQTRNLSQENKKKSEKSSWKIWTLLAYLVWRDQTKKEKGVH